MRVIRFSIVLLVCLLASYGVVQILMPVPSVSEFAVGRIDTIAHQGGNLEMPDATLDAFDAAVQNGADVLEMDVHLTLDGQLLVMHDERIDRTTNGRGAVREMTLAQLQSFDAAYWWPYHSNDDIEKQRVPSDMTFPFRDQGISSPSLDEILQRYPNHRLVIELKDDSDELRHALSSKLTEYQRWNSTLVASFYQRTLQKLRAEQPQAQSYAAENEIRLFYVLHVLRLERLFPYLVPVDAMAVPMTSGGFNLATPRFVAAAHNAGLLVHYWTINDADDMTTLMRIGADGLITDRPAMLRDVKNQLLSLGS